MRRIKDVRLIHYARRKKFMPVCSESGRWELTFNQMAKARAGSNPVTGTMDASYNGITPLLHGENAGSIPAASTKSFEPPDLKDLFTSDMFESSCPSIGLAF